MLLNFLHLPTTPPIRGYNIQNIQMTHTTQQPKKQTIPLKNGLFSFVCFLFCVFVFFEGGVRKYEVGERIQLGQDWRLNVSLGWMCGPEPDSSC